MTLPLASTYNPLGFDMKGISPKGKCPVCGSSFKFIASRLAFVCPVHPKVQATRFIVAIFYKGERIRRATNLDGETLETFAQAHALLNQAETEKRNKRFDPKRWKSKIKFNYTFEALVDKWMGTKEELLEEGRRAPSYVSELPTYINRFFLQVYEGQDVREIHNLDEFSAHLSRYRKNNGDPISLKYKKNLVDCLQSFFNWLKKKKYIMELPDFPETIEVPEHQPQTIEKDVQLKLLAFIPEEHKPIFTWLFYQGCRPGEARALMGDCILDGEEPRDTVEYKRTFSDNILMERTKGKNIRYNYIFPEVRAVLPDVPFPKSFVFTHGVKVRRPYSKPFLNKIYRLAVAAFNEEYGTSLDVELYEATKHSFGTQNRNKGVPLEWLRRWYGHTSDKMTEKYAKLDVVRVFRDRETVVSINSIKIKDEK